MAAATYRSQKAQRPQKTGRAQVGVLGLGSMGGHMMGLFSERGDRVTGFDLDEASTKTSMDRLRKDKRIDESRVETHQTMSDFVASFSPDSRRVIVLSLPHGKPGDRVLDELLPLLDAGDIILDGANEHFRSTERRQGRCQAKGVHHLGVGVSGGYQSARNGPSLSPGGSREAYEIAKPFLLKWAAQDDRQQPQCRYIGPGGSGHFVKAIHNGIEQGILSLMCEVYGLLRHTCKFSNDEIADIFDDWNTSDELKTTFLIYIGADALRFKKGDGVQNPQGIVDDVDDKVVQDTDDTEGTGVWTCEELAARHIAGNTIFAAHSLRIASSEEDQRIVTARLLDIPKPAEAPASLDRGRLIGDLRLALYAGTLAAFAQGLNLIYHGSLQEHWGIDLLDCLAIWRAGCIIQSHAVTTLLEGAYQRHQDLPHPMMDERVAQAARSAYDALKRVCLLSVEVDAVTPALTASLEYYKAIGGRALPTTFEEVELDVFGSHSYDLRWENQFAPKKGTHHTEFRPA